MPKFYINKCIFKRSPHERILRDKQPLIIWKSLSHTKMWPLAVISCESGGEKIVEFVWEGAGGSPALIIWVQNLVIASRPLSDWPYQYHISHTARRERVGIQPLWSFTHIQYIYREQGYCSASWCAVAALSLVTHMMHFPYYFPDFVSDLTQVQHI